MKTKHFDVAGVFAFLYVILFSLYLLRDGEVSPISIYVLLTVDAGGLLVDVVKVYVNFIKKK